jgi:roadblock/LC7 domain-containing protein
MKTPRIAWLLVGVVSLGLGYACSSNSGNTVAGAGGAGAFGGSGGGSGNGGSGADGGINLDSGQPNIMSLAVVPATGTIDVTNGQSSPLSFKAMATYKGGSQGEVQATWSFDRLDLATIAQTGTLTANNTKGGKGTVTAKVGSQSATASVVIQLAFDDNSAGLSKADQGKFLAPDTNPSGTLLYPYDQTVFARGILPPELMWSGGAQGDSYKVSIVDSNVSLTAFIHADPPSRWTMPKAWWEALTQSNSGTPVSVKVQRLDGAGAAHAAMSETWQIAQGSLRGTIYYWAVNQGQIVKINPGADKPVPAFDPGPYNQLGSPAPVSGYANQNPPWQQASGGHRCVACHTVSKDGSTIAAVFSAPTPVGGSAGPWGTVNSTSEQVQALGDYTAKVRFMALTPDGKYIVSNSDGFTMALGNATNGQPMASALDSMTQMADPQFSPDGKLLAFAGNVTGSYPVEFTQSDLQVMDANMTAAPYFSNLQTIVTGGGQEIAFPSFAPDSKWVVYQRGDYSRASYGAGGASTGHNDLYMADVAKQVGELKLDLANGAGVLGAKDSQRNYEPRVNPISVGGYYWVVFVSPRDYGNRMQSTTDSTTENHKQLWVAAIDANPTAGKDPSHPAFWLPGQDLTTINMDAYWALEACHQQGDSCSQGYECCSGFCRDQGNGTYACVPPPTNQCAQIGESCKTAADCCKSSGTVDCVGGFCALKGPA